VGRPNYKADKRRREVERQKKQEAKREKRLHSKEEEGGGADVADENVVDESTSETNREQDT